MPTIEPTINDALAAVLRTYRVEWSKTGVVKSENSGALTGAGRPDILIMEAGSSPVVIETEVLPAVSVEAEARSRLGLKLKATGRLIYSSVAVRMPASLRSYDGNDLSEALRNECKFEFACFTWTGAASSSRWPAKGWLSGTVIDLCLIVQAMTIPPTVVEEAANRLVQGVSEAAGLMDELAGAYGSALREIAATLRQEDGTQTRRMAATILINAFVFHSTLAGRSGQLATVRSLRSLRGLSGVVSPSILLDEWRKILAVNYWPIFDIARRIVELLPSSSASEILSIIMETADAVLDSGLTKSHDLVGAVFQKLISDRKFLAAFYTRPESAALLAGLALTPQHTPRGMSWREPDHVTALRFADFACGTGTLLSTLYHLTRQYHEISGGDEAKLHATMMSDVLVGCDIMPAAAHITASMLSGAHPATTYKESSIMTMPYGLQLGGGVALGALDLLHSQRTLSILATREAALISSTGERSADAWRTISDEAFDVVIMNPPFTRATNHEGNGANVPNPMFAAFESSPAEQRAMSRRMQVVARNTSYHGNAGEASAFIALADRKLASGGQLAMVLPLSFQVGAGWEASRALMARGYGEIVVVSIASAKDTDASFSADTGMAECLLVARKGKRSDEALFVMLNRAPVSALEGAQMARVVSELRTKTVRALDDGPFGGTPICLGEETVGHVIRGPIAAGAPWAISRVYDLSVAQAAYQLVAKGLLWLPGVDRKHAVSLRTCALGEIASFGPLDRDINGTEFGGTCPRGPFDIQTYLDGEIPTFPTLWGHEADAERKLVVAPDRKATVRIGNTVTDSMLIQEKAERVWQTASRCHFNRDFRFNSQSLGACYTTYNCIGGRAWPSVRFALDAYEKVFVLWCNSTLGLLCHWWRANKPQSGRGMITLTSLPSLITLDLRALSANQLDLAAIAFDSICGKDLLPFSEIKLDYIRVELDRAILVDVLGLPASITNDGGPISLLRRKLASEPSIHGGRGSRKQML